MKPRPPAVEPLGRSVGRALTAWFRAHARDLPWRRARTPYRTWVSEVMLQQTTVEVVKDRFPAFLARFPDLASLARAEVDEVLSAWSGLGYYRRARALHAGARETVERHGGIVPSELTALRALPGVGPYTAQAIRAFAFGLPAAPLDGNVTRVLARWLAERRDTRRADVRRSLERAALAIQAPDDGATIAEALIELGALVCRPQAPGCKICPVVAACGAHALEAVDVIPLRRERFAATPVVSVRALLRRPADGALALIRRAPDAELLPGFLELPGRWCTPADDPRGVLSSELRCLGWSDDADGIGEPMARANHTITHHRIKAELRPVLEGEAIGADIGWYPVTDGLLSAVTTETRKLLAAAGVFST